MVAAQRAVAATNGPVLDPDLVLALVRNISIFSKVRVLVLNQPIKYFLSIMPESWKILGPTWLNDRPWLVFLTHFEPSGVSEMDSQRIFRPD